MNEYPRCWACPLYHYEEYAVVRVPIFLSLGSHTLSLVRATASGSTNFLNLDSLTVEDHRLFLPLLGRAGPRQAYPASP